MRRIGSVLVLLGAISACASDPAPEAAAPVVAMKPVAEQAPAAELPPPPPAPPPLADIEEPASIACRVGGAATDTAFRLSPDGPVFANVRNVQSESVLPIGEPTSAVGVVSASGLLLRGFVPREKVAIHPRKGLTLLGVAIPKDDALLIWRGGAPGFVKVALHVGSVEGGIVVDDTACATVSGEPSKFDARAAITNRRGLAKRSLEKKGIGVAASPGGPALVLLNEGVGVEVLEARARATRILIDDPEAYVVGWVDSQALGTTSPLFGLFGRGEGGRYGLSAFNGHLRTCAHDLPLFAEVGKQRARVGTIQKGGGFRVEASAEGGDEKALLERVVTFPSIGWLTPAKGTRWLVPASALAECGT